MSVKNNCTIFFALLITGLFTSFHSFGWGKEGHRLVAEVASHYMSKATHEKVSRYLAGMSFEDAATWMDDIRSDPKYRHMSAWHYIDIPKGERYVAHPGEVNIINEIDKATHNLEHRSTLDDEDIKFNILVLFHLIGDLHQPLHTGYADDRGGNEVEVRFITRKSKLHSVWDGGIIKEQKITLDDCLAQYRSYTPMQIKQIRKLDDVAWLNQSRAYLPQVYDFRDDFIDEHYAEKNKTVVEKQILCGGLRLAALLDSLFRN